MRARRPNEGDQGFTLIELLIVVAIIAILAAIAVPNFLEAQMRAKVSRIKNDMRTLATAVNSYRVDHNAVPVRRNSLGTPSLFPVTAQFSTRAQQMGALTTPISYLTSLPIDVLDPWTPAPNNLIEYYDQQQTAWFINALKLVSHNYIYQPEEVSFTLLSVGPDGYFGGLDDRYQAPTVQTPEYLQGSYVDGYDPTNGTVSPGNIYYNEDGGMDSAAIKLREKIRRVR